MFGLPSDRASPFHDSLKNLNDSCNGTLAITLADRERTTRHLDCFQFPLYTYLYLVEGFKHLKLNVYLTKSTQQGGQGACQHLLRLGAVLQSQ